MDKVQAEERSDETLGQLAKTKCLLYLFKFAKPLLLRLSFVVVLQHLVEKAARAQDR